MSENRDRADAQEPLEALTRSVHAGVPSKDAEEAITLPPAPAPGLLVATPGQRFGDYELLELIARGGMGVVYKARQVSLNRTVALKMILAGQLASEADVQRFHQEAQTAAVLQHPHIVAIHEVGEHDGQHFFSMDYVEGHSLADLMRQHPLPPREAARFVHQIAGAIQCAHEHGVLHCDVKPSNVLIDRANQPRVTDFGLAGKSWSCGLPRGRTPISGCLGCVRKGAPPAGSLCQQATGGAAKHLDEPARRGASATHHVVGLAPCVAVR